MNESSRFLRKQSTLPAATSRISVVVPSVIAVGEPFTVRICAVDADQFPARIDEPIQVEPAEEFDRLPRKIDLEAGSAVIEDVRVVREGLGRLTLTVGSYRVHSNPVLVERDPRERIWWGDLHVHSTLGECSMWSVRDPEFAYAYAREVSALDFCAVTDHAYGLDADKWKRLKRLARDFNRPGDFVTFLGFESSHTSAHGGDNNVYFAGDEGEYFRPSQGRTTTPGADLSELWRFLDGRGLEYVTVAHHTSRAAKFRDFELDLYNAAREPLMEVYSMWCSSETSLSRHPQRRGDARAKAFFRDALVAGCRYGLIASSDDHTTMPGSESRHRNPFGVLDSAYAHKGLTAIRAPELTRDALWRGLVSRNCCGTTFGRSILRFHMDDVRMGEAASVSARDPLARRRTFTIQYADAFGDAMGFTATLIRNGEEIGAISFAGPDADFTFEDAEPLGRIAVRGALHYPDPFVVYYVRVERADGQTAWSSPIWVDLT